MITPRLAFLLLSPLGVAACAFEAKGGPTPTAGAGVLMDGGVGSDAASNTPIPYPAGGDPRGCKGYCGLQDFAQTGWTCNGRKTLAGTVETFSDAPQRFSAGHGACFVGDYGKELRDGECVCDPTSGNLRCDIQISRTRLELACTYTAP